MSSIISLRSLLKIEVSDFGGLLQLLGTLLQFKQIVVSRLNTLVVVSVLTLFAGNDISEAIHITLITLSLFLELLEFKTTCINVLSKGK